MIENKLLVAQVNAAVLLEKTQKFQTENSEKPKWTPLSYDTIVSRHIVCYIPANRFKTPKVVERPEAISLIEAIKHIDDVYILDALTHLSQIRLRNLQVTIIFLPYDKSVVVREHLVRMLWLKRHLQPDNKSGKLDYGKLERSFTSSLPRQCTAAEYIAGTKRYSYAYFLGMSTRGLSATITGDSHAA